MANFYQDVDLHGRVRIEHRTKEGNLLNEREFKNVVTVSGRFVAASLLIGTTATNATFIGLGSGLTLITSSMNSLLGEYTLAGAGLTRTSATVSIVQPTSARWVFTWTCGSDNMPVQSECIGHTVSTASILVAAQSFASITLNSGDTLQVTHDISFN